MKRGIAERVEASPVWQERVAFVSHLDPSRQVAGVQFVSQAEGHDAKSTAENSAADRQTVMLRG